MSGSVCGSFSDPFSEVDNDASSCLPDSSASNAVSEVLVGTICSDEDSSVEGLDESLAVSLLPLSFESGSDSEVLLGDSEVEVELLISVSIDEEDDVSSTRSGVDVKLWASMLAELVVWLSVVVEVSEVVESVEVVDVGVVEAAEVVEVEVVEADVDVDVDIDDEVDVEVDIVVCALSSSFRSADVEALVNVSLGIDRSTKVATRDKVGSAILVVVVASVVVEAAVAAAMNRPESS